MDETLHARAILPFMGTALLNPLYDLASAALRREGRWRSALIAQVDPQPQETILDVVCGNGALAVALKAKSPQTSVYGTDPDTECLNRAEQKAKARNALVHFSFGTGRDLRPCTTGRKPHKIVSSLVFHRLPLPAKRAMLSAMHQVLAPGGSLHIADYGLQRGWMMRHAFKTVQKMYGHDAAAPNVRGMLPELMFEAGFRDVLETHMFATPTGSISLYRARKD